VVTRSGFTPARFWFFQGLAHERTSEGVQVLLLSLRNALERLQFFHCMVVQAQIASIDENAKVF